MKIAFIGAGKMGLPICRRLRIAGHDLTVLTRRAGLENDFRERGIKFSKTVSSMIHDANLVFTCLSDDAALADVIINDFFASTINRNATLIDMSTVSPEISARVAAHLPNEVEFLRSPVSGSTGMAEAGTLTAIVSGPRSKFDELATVFEIFTKKAIHVGEGEEARYMKLVLNSMVAATSALLGEALALGAKGGLTHAAMLDVITQSAVASPLIGYKKDMIISGDYKPAATLNMLKKDLDLFLVAGNENDIAMPINAAIKKIYDAASQKGLGEKDFFVLVKEAEDKGFT